MIVRTSTESCEAALAVEKTRKECSSSPLPLSGSVAKMETLVALTGIKSFPQAKVPVVSKDGLAYVGGTNKGMVSLHGVGTGERLTQSVCPSDCKFVSFNSMRWHWVGGC